MKPSEFMLVIHEMDECGKEMPHHCDCCGEDFWGERVEILGYTFCWDCITDNRKE